MAFGLLVLGVAALWGGPILTGTWYEFHFEGAGIPATGCAPADPGAPTCIAPVGPLPAPVVFADAPPWVFTAPIVGATLTVAEAFELGDRFAVFDFVLKGVTSEPLGPPTDCGPDPYTCLGNGTGHFFFAPGPHSVTITPVTTPFGPSAAFFFLAPGTLIPVPEPATVLLLTMGLVGILMLKWRRS